MRANRFAAVVLGIVSQPAASGSLATRATEAEDMECSGECVWRSSGCAAPACYLAMEEKMGSREAVADYCYLGTFRDDSSGETLDENLTSNTAVRSLDGLAGCERPGSIRLACRCAVPRDRDWKFPQCRTDVCYVVLDMFLGGGPSGFCKALLSGRGGALERPGQEGEACGFAKQLQACRCVEPEPEEPKVESAGPECDGGECRAILEKHFGGHAQAYCKTVLAGDADRQNGLPRLTDKKGSGASPVTDSNLDEPSHIIFDAKELGCEYDKLLQACRCLSPAPPQRQHPACADDKCYGAMDDYFARENGTVDDYCSRVAGLPPAEAERDPLRSRFGAGCGAANDVASACACVTKTWTRPECAADACYRGIEQAAGGDLAGFCTQAFRDPTRAPEAALPGVGGSCADAAALQEACRCVHPRPEENLNDLAPLNCYRDRCFRSIDGAFNGSVNHGVQPFCSQTLRELWEYRNAAPPANYSIMPGLEDGCPDAREVGSACSCVVPEDDIWPHGDCVDNRCYRRLEMAASGGAYDLCKKWHRSRAIPDLVPPPAAPDLHDGCPSEDDIEAACSCVSPKDGAGWAAPQCAQQACYPELDEAIGQVNQVHGFCRQLLQSRLYPNVAAPETPSRLGGRCAEPEAMAEACRCVVPEEKGLKVALPDCAGQGCYSEIDRAFFSGAQRIRGFCHGALQQLADDVFHNPIRGPDRSAWAGCRFGKEALKLGCSCAVPDDSVWQFPACKEQQCYRGVERTLGQETRDFCQKVVAGEELDLDGAKKSALFSRCNGQEPPEEDGGREMAEPEGFQDKLKTACQCVLADVADPKLSPSKKES
ncbi:hypothetical protein CDD83_10612 [Cordyceps sp. RAO-2017]|nr:hypothetical protein CDD83_10612 [Cordyceps sp. RAO-2017]